MAPSKHLSEDLKQHIVDAWQENPEVSYGSLGERFKVSKQTVYSLIKRFQERGTVSNAKAPGKARETSNRTDRLIKRECEKNPFMSARYLFLIFLCLFQSNLRQCRWY